MVTNSQPLIREAKVDYVSELEMTVTRAEFQDFVRRCEDDRKEQKDMLKKLLESSLSTGPRDHEVGSRSGSAFDKFKGVIPHPNSARSSHQTSFVNVAASLKAGIDAYNSSVCDGEPGIETTELGGSLLSWSHNAFSSVTTIIGRYAGLNGALGKVSLDEAKKLPQFSKRPSKYNREVAAVLGEIIQVLPIVALAKGDWAARELLRNKFQNATTANKRKNKANGKKLRTNVDQEEHEVNDVNGHRADATKATVAPACKTINRLGMAASRVVNNKEKAVVSSRSSSETPQERGTRTTHRFTKPGRKIGTTALLAPRKLKRIFDDEESDGQSELRAREYRKTSSAAKMPKKGKQSGPQERQTGAHSRMGVKKLQRDKMLSRPQRGHRYVASGSKSRENVDEDDSLIRGMRAADVEDITRSDDQDDDAESEYYEEEEYDEEDDE